MKTVNSFLGVDQQQKLDKYVKFSTIGKLHSHEIAKYQPQKKWLALWEHFDAQFKRELEERQTKALEKKMAKKSLKKC